jgi:TatD DNase family protein
MPKLFDCHTHLNQYPESEIEEILDRANAAGVAGVILAGSDVKSSKQCIDLAEQNYKIFAGVGIHPMDVEVGMNDHTVQILFDMALDSSRVITVSEVGLDGMSGAPDIGLQEKILRAQIGMARDLRLPIIYHARFTYPRVLDILQEEKAFEVGGAAHYFQGDLSTAKRCIDLGFFISLARPLLRMPELQEVARKLPLEYIVLETDSYPQPFKKYRERWTEPRHILEIVETLSTLKEIDIETVIRQIAVNTEKMLSSRGAEVKALMYG